MVSGEVNRPGIYSIDVKGVNQLANNDGGERSSINTYGWPTLVDAIQKAGGITPDSDLKNIQLLRKLPGTENRYKTAKLDHSPRLV